MSDENLNRNSSYVDLQVWPGPIVEMFLGEKTTEQVLSGLTSGTDPDSVRVRGEAYFFIAEKMLFNNNRALAKKYLEQAVNTNESPSNEHTGARAELERIGS